VTLLWLALAATATAEQKQMIGGFEAHYSLVPTSFLKPDIAAEYGVTRARDRALLNISIIDPETGPVRAAVSGGMRNLLEQRETLSFREVLEGPAVYYLAEVRYTDRDVLRFALEVETPDGIRHTLAFTQRMYWDGR